MDMLAMCSVGGETFGRVSVEAQACGVPVLCSNNGGIPETLLPASRPAAAARRCRRLARGHPATCSNPLQRTQMITSGRYWPNTTSARR